MEELEYRQATLSDADVLVELWWTMESSHDRYDTTFYRDVGEARSKELWRGRFEKLMQDEKSLVDDVIDPRETRPRVVRALELALRRRGTPPSPVMRHGVMP